MQKLPEFTLRDYERLIVGLKQNGYEFRSVSEMPGSIHTKSVYLRHDIDLHIRGIDRIAEIEAAQGVRATYFVPLTLHFNPFYPENAQILRALVRLGHEVGLHYDLAVYPTDPTLARERLHWEASALSRVTDAPVRSICMHQPYLGLDDPFRHGDEFVNPHDQRNQEGLLYISDSCRAWRDEQLLQCFGPAAPRRMLLNTHPEVWFAETPSHRLEYLENCLIHQALAQHQDYFKAVAHVWRTHSAPQMHDARELRLPPDPVQ
jgi:hypothetical protein